LSFLVIFLTERNRKIGVLSYFSFERAINFGVAVSGKFISLIRRYLLA
jgi:hypothetical protein